MAKEFEKMRRNEKVKYFSDLEHNQPLTKQVLDKCIDKPKMLDAIRPINQSLANYLMTLSFQRGLQFVWDVFLDQTGNPIDEI